MPTRGLRGAITVDENETTAILEATHELLTEIIARNEIKEFDDIVSAIFTVSPDLNACFPAEAARALGMGDVPLLCAKEIEVPGAMPSCIRILLHVETQRTPKEMQHVYLRNAKNLRPDKCGAQ